MGRRNRLRKKWRKKRQKNKSLKLEKRQLAADFERKKKNNTINEKKKENEKERTSVKACISSYKSVCSSLMLIVLRF